MSKVSENIARQLRWARNKLQGDVVYFEGRAYRATTSVVAGAITGAQTLSQEVFGPFIASSDSREFQFSPQDFKPWTDVQAPQEGQILTWYDLKYLVAAVTFQSLADGTLAVICRCFRHLND